MPVRAGPVPVGAGPCWSVPVGAVWCRHVPVGAGLGRSVPVPVTVPVPVPVLVTVPVLVPAPGVGNGADRCRSVPRSLKDRKKRCNVIFTVIIKSGLSIGVQIIIFLLGRQKSNDKFFKNFLQRYSNSFRL